MKVQITLVALAVSTFLISSPVKAETVTEFMCRNSAEELYQGVAKAKAGDSRFIQDWYASSPERPDCPQYNEALRMTKAYIRSVNRESALEQVREVKETVRAQAEQDAVDFENEKIRIEARRVEELANRKADIIRAQREAQLRTAKDKADSSVPGLTLIERQNQYIRGVESQNADLKRARRTVKTRVECENRGGVRSCEAVTQY